MRGIFELGRGCLVIKRNIFSGFWFLLIVAYLCTPKVLKTYAEVAQLVEHHLAKVRVAGSNLVFRS